MRRRLPKGEQLEVLVFHTLACNEGCGWPLEEIVEYVEACDAHEEAVAAESDEGLFFPGPAAQAAKQRVNEADDRLREIADVIRRNRARSFATWREPRMVTDANAGRDRAGREDVRPADQADRSAAYESVEANAVVDPGSDRGASPASALVGLSRTTARFFWRYPGVSVAASSATRFCLVWDCGHRTYFPNKEQLTLRWCPTCGCGRRFR